MRSGILKRGSASRERPDLRERSGSGSRRASPTRHFLLGFTATLALATLLQLDFRALGAVLPPRTALLLWGLHVPMAVLVGLAAVVAGRMNDRAGRTLGAWLPGLAYAFVPLWSLSKAAAGAVGPILLLVLFVVFLLLGARTLAARRRTSAPLLVAFLLPAAVILPNTRLAWYLPRPVPSREATLTILLFLGAMAVVLILSGMVTRVGRSTSVGARALAFLAGVLAFLSPFLLPEHLARPEESAVSEGWERVPRLPADETPPDIILLSLDTLRRDRTSVYDPSLNTTPNLESFAREALVFESAISASPWTLPSHASLFTGLFPSEHGAVGREQGAGGNPIPESASMLAEELGHRGYLTGGFVANSGFLNERYGFARGFDVYRYETPVVLSDPWLSIAFRGTHGKARGLFQRFGVNLMHLGPAMNRWALRWVDAVAERADGARSRPPIFLFINYMEAHGVEYLPFREGDAFSRDYLRYDEEFLQRQADAIRSSSPLDSETTSTFFAWYDLEVRHLDMALGELFDALRERGLYRDAVIIVWSDHGELFGEHGSFGHRTDLFEELVRVPLLLKMPKDKEGMRASSGRTDGYVQSTDLRPFLLRTAGGGSDAWARPLPEPLASCFLPGGAAADSAAGGVLAASELFRYPSEAERYPERYERDLRAIYWRDGDGPVLKYTLSTRGEEDLIDLSNDPREQHDLSDSLKTRKAELARRMAAWLEARQPVPGAGAGEESEELKTLLRSLGYID